MSRIQDQEVWDQYTADYYAEATAAGRVAAVPVPAHRGDRPAGEAAVRCMAEAHGCGGRASNQCWPSEKILDHIDAREDLRCFEISMV